MIRHILIGGIFFLSVPFFAYAQLTSDVSGMYEAAVRTVSETVYEDVPGTNARHIRQPIEIEFLEGPLVHEVRGVVNELTPVSVGTIVYVQYIQDIDGVEYLYVFEVQRSWGIYVFLIVFATILIVFGGMQGVRALLALTLGLLGIAYVLIPGLLAGYSPVLISIAVAATVLFLALMLTHGFNRGALIAFLGTTLAVCITGFFALYAIRLVHLTGIPSETEWYLALNAGHSIDLLGLLLGGIIIGVLGALDDIAITQVATVQELYAANTQLTPYDVYTRAMRVGKAHVGSLVNTLALAYTGAALPLLLLFYSGGASGVPFTNLEVFATEIVRILVSSIGLVLTVPITTVLAAYGIRGHAHTPSLHMHSH